MQNQEQIPISFLDRTDAVLAKQLLSGDQKAFERLVQHYHVALFNFISRFLGDDNLASDVLQRVFLRFYTSLPKLGRREPFKLWLFQTAHLSCVDELRRKYPLYFSQLEKNEEELVGSSNIADLEPCPLEVAERDDLQALLQQAILALPPTLRSVIILRYSSHMSFAEIGQILSLPEARAKTFFRRANQLLRQNVKEISQHSQGQIIIHQDHLELNGFLLQVGDEVEILHLGSWIPGIVAHNKRGWHILTKERMDVYLQIRLPARLLSLTP